MWLDFFKIRDLRIVFFRSNRIGRPIRFLIKSSNRNGCIPQRAVTQPNGLQVYRTACYRPIICWRLALWTCVLYLIHRYFVFVTNESDVRTTELRTEYLFISIQSQNASMLLYANFTPKVYFKCKFNHHQSFLYEWRLTAWTIRKFRIGPSIRIEARIGRTIQNRITKLRRALFKMPEKIMQLICLKH